MHFRKSALALLATLSLASAWNGHSDRRLAARGDSYDSEAASSAPVPTLPVNGGPRELSGPPAGLKLKYIALGVGVQNYSCAVQNGAAVATGALAMLYDLTPYYPGQSRRSFKQDTFDSIPSVANHQHAERLNFDPFLPNRLPAAHTGVSQTRPFGPDAPLNLKGFRECFRFLGHHYFDAAGSPNFVLADGAIQLRAKKNDSIAAPATADPGAEKTGAVQWLQLEDAGGSVGATFVYRVVTVGGNSHTCASGTGGDTTTYATYYWFYG